MTHLRLIPGGLDDSWRADALCAGSDRVLFFPGHGMANREAKRLCSLCPVRRQCLDYALSEPDLCITGTGIWAGTTPNERKRMVHAQRRIGGAA